MCIGRPYNTEWRNVAPNPRIRNVNLDIEKINYK